jgi:Cu/Ag efflux protein CusF
MRKVLGLTLALLLTFTLSAVADEAMGKVKAVDRADKSIVLEDGTKLWVSDSQISGLAAGDQVRAVYELDGGKKIVAGINHHTIGTENRWTVSYGATYGDPIDTLQAAE